MTEPNNFKTTKLSEKALEVKLVIRRTALVRRDAAMTAQLQQTDTSAVAFTKLFRRKDGPIAALMAAVGEVYAYHVKNTVRADDKRLLKSECYFEYTNDIRQLIAAVDKRMRGIVPVYDQLVVEDIAYRNAGRVGGTSVVVDAHGRALYFSKKLIPYLPMDALDHEMAPVRLHIGVYAYRPAALATYVATPPSELETLEGLEQLRFLVAGVPIDVVDVATPAFAMRELNNPEDVTPIEDSLKMAGLE